MPAVPAIIGGGAAILGGAIAHDASRKGTNTAADAARYTADKSSAAQERMYNQTRSDFEPYRQAGVQALPQLQNAGLPNLPENFKFSMDPNDEIYRWKQEQGEEAINRALAARGLYNSRAGVNTIADFNKDLAAEESTMQYNRALEKYGLDYSRATDLYNTKYGNALNLANIGRGASTTTAQAGTNTANALANIYQNQGNQLGNIAMQGAANKASSINSGIAGVLGAYNNYNLYNMLNQNNSALDWMNSPGATNMWGAR